MNYNDYPIDDEERPYDTSLTQWSKLPGLSDYDSSSSPNSRDLLAGIQERFSHFDIRSEQVACLDAIESARKNGGNRALVQMATGLGKTVVMAADAKRFLEESPNSRVLFLCHQNDILEQAKESFEQIIGEHNSYGIFTGESKDYHDVTCLFASFQAMREWHVAFKEDEFDYVIVDESHHSKANTYEPTLRHFSPGFMLGMTATPDRYDLRDIREIFGSEIFKLPLEQALAEGLLTPVDYSIIADDVVETGVVKDVRGRIFSAQSLDRTLFAPKRDEEIVKIIGEKTNELEVDPRRLAFCKSVEQAVRYAGYFDKAVALYSKLPKPEQDQIIEHFKNGKINTLFTVDMFNEGIDVPDANQIIFLRSTSSKTVFLQQLGRGLRKYPGKNKVQVLDFVANCDRLQMLDSLWKDVASYTAEAVEKDDADHVILNVNNVNFTETSREVLDVLADIESAAQAINDIKREGWMSLHELSKDLGVSRWIIGSIAKRLGHGATSYETYRGKTELFSPSSVSQISNWLEQNYSQPADDYRRFDEVATELGVHEDRLEKMCQEIEIEPVLHISDRGGGRLVPYLSPEQVLRLGAHEHAHLMPAPEGYLNKNQIKDLLRISFKHLTLTMERLGIQAETYLTPKKYAASYLSPAQVETVLEELANKEKVTPDHLYYTQVRELLDISTEYTLDRICNELNITPIILQDNRRRTLKCLTVDEVERIANHEYVKTPRAPEGYANMTELQALTGGLSDVTIHRIVENLGLKWHTYKSHLGSSITTLSKFLSPEHIEMLMQHPLVTTPTAPGGYQSTREIAQQLGVVDSTVKRAAKEAGLLAQVFRGQNGRLIDYFSPEQFEQIATHPQMALGEAPEGYMTQNDITKQLFNGNHALIRQAIKAAGIIGEDFKHPKIKRVATYYSPQQVEEIVRLLTNDKQS